MGDSRTTRRNEATARSIVAAAAALLAEGGPDAVTLEAISARADVAVQTVYNRVGNRLAVLIAVAEQALADNRVYVDRAYASEGTALERMGRAADAYIRFAVDCPHQFQLLAFPPPGMPASERLEALGREQVGKLASLLRDGIAEGSLRDDIDPDRLAVVVWRLFDGVLSLAFRPDGLRVQPEELPELLNTTRFLLGAALRAATPGPLPHSPTTEHERGRQP